MMEDYFMAKQKELEQNQKEQQANRKNKQLFDRFMVQSCLRFIKFRKRRFLEQVPTLRNFLSGIYHEAKREFPVLVH